MVGVDAIEFVDLDELCMHPYLCIEVVDLML